jgi:acetyl esterase/lipase
MSAQKFKKGLISFLFSMLFVLTSCSNSTSGPGEQQGVSSSSSSHPSSSSEVADSSSSEESDSSSSEVADSSSSEVAESSSSEVADSSNSEVAESSSSEVVISSSSVAASSSSRVTTSSSSRAVSSSSAAASSSSRVTTSSSSRAVSSSSVAASSSSQASTPITTRSWTNVDYAPTASRRHSRQRYDIKLPSSGDGPFPLLIYVHGGGFSGGDWQLAQNNNGLVQRANSNGYAVASVGYLLMGQSGWSGGQRAFPENVEDVLAAIRHLRANASTYHIDPDKFAVSGFSAGAYMTAIVCALSNATNHGYDITSLGNAGVSHAVQGAASSAALTDFSLLETHESINGGGMLDHDASPEGAMLGGNLKNDKDKEPMKTYLKMQNPLTHISANTPPIYMMHGTSDNLVPWQQSEIMVNKVNSFVANKAKFNKVSGRSHADFEGASAASTVEILQFLDKALGIQR